MTTPQTRTAYRALLRELPRRNKTRLLAVPPTPLHQRLRDMFRTPSSTTTTSSSPPRQPQVSAETETQIETVSDRVQEAEQLAAYARAQRTYATLLERYNPGISVVDQQERIRLTARRVGMDLPGGWADSDASGQGGSGQGSK
jgi:ATP synthase assembly factor FMC1